MTFDRVSVPKSLKIFYRVVPVDVYVPNPLRCFNCQRFGHHENNCTEDPGSVCENSGADGHAHPTSQCKNPTRCINCGKDHSPKSNICEVWLKEKAIMKLKVTNNISYLEAKKLHKNKPETSFSKIVQSIARPEMKDASTQYKVKDYKINASTKVIEPKVKSTPKSQSGSQSSQSSSSSAPCHPGGRNRWLLCACSRWVRPPLYNATVRYTVPSNSLKQQKSIIRSLFFQTYRSNV